MKNKLGLLAVVAVMAAGCGKAQVGGNYMGPDIQSNSQSTTSGSYPYNNPYSQGSSENIVSAQFTQNGSSVTGTWSENQNNNAQSGAYPGYTGTVGGQNFFGSFDGSNLTVLGLPLSGGSYNAQCIYTGQLQMSGTTLQGTLNGVSSSGSGSVNGLNVCPVRTVQLTQISQ